MFTQMNKVPGIVSEPTLRLAAAAEKGDLSAARHKVEERTMSLRVWAKIASLTTPSLRLVFAVEKNNVGAIERELRNGADPNFQTFEGATMLMAAIANGHRDAAKALLEGGADPNRVSQFGNTVMDLAAEAADADSVVMLLEYGALPSEKLFGSRAHPNSAWEAERKEYETLLTQQSEKLEKLERAPAGQASAAASASAANLKKLLDEHAGEFQKEQAERKRVQAELAAHQDLVDELVSARTGDLRLEVERSQAEIDKHKRSLGEMAAQCDDLKSQVEATTAQLDTITAEHATLKGDAKAAAEASVSMMERETEERARVEKLLSDERDQFKALAEGRSEKLDEQATARQRLEKDLSAVTDRLAAKETKHVEALQIEVAARDAAEQELSETKVSLEASIESKTQFLAELHQQIQNHLSTGAEGTIEPEAATEDEGNNTKDDEEARHVLANIYCLIDQGNAANELACRRGTQLSDGGSVRRLSSQL